MAKRKSRSSPELEQLKKFFNHYIIKSILILVFAGGFIFYGTLVALRHYTRHGEALTVPDLSGLTLEEAEKLLQAQKLRWQLTDSVYDKAAIPGAVVSQYPEPGAKVKQKRNIFLIINALAPEKVKMPNVVDLSLRQAVSTLESQGLIVGEMTYVPDIAKDYVLKQLYRGQEIRSGTEILKGTEIDLMVGRGLSDEWTPVPNLLGNTLPEARETLTKYFMNFGVIIHDNTVVTGADSLSAFIYRQSPAAIDDAMLQLGSSIDVWVTVDESKKPEIIPPEEESE